MLVVFPNAIISFWGHWLCYHLRKGVFASPPDARSCFHFLVCALAWFIWWPLLYFITYSWNTFFQNPLHLCKHKLQVLVIPIWPTYCNKAICAPGTGHSVLKFSTSNSTRKLKTKNKYKQSHSQEKVRLFLIIWAYYSLNNSFAFLRLHAVRADHFFL